MKNTHTFTRACMRIALCLVLFGFPAKLFASHFAAVDMRADFIGTASDPYLYRVTLTVYKACEPSNMADLSVNEDITISSVSMDMNAVSYTLPSPDDDTLDQLCDFYSRQNSCYSPSSRYPGFVRRIYTAEISLPGYANDYIFDWSKGSRNGGVMNLCNPNSQNIHIQMLLNNEINHTNSSPRFTIAPIPYFCTNLPTTMYNGPLDPDGDSLSVINTRPLGCSGGCNSNSCPTSGPDYLFYNTNYSLTNPLGANANYRVDAGTGTASFLAPITGKYVLAFRCNEYDPVSGALIGYISRDVQIAVLNCNSLPPDISKHPSNVTGATIDTSAGNQFTLCAGSKVTFDIDAVPKNQTNAVYMTANTAPNMSFVFRQVNPGRYRGGFTYTPTLSDVGDHTVTIEAKDSACTGTSPIVFRSFITVQFRVVRPLDAGPDRTGYCPLDKTPIQLTATGSPGIRYSWTQINGSTEGISDTSAQSPYVTPDGTTTYVVYTPDLPRACKARDTITVFRDSLNSVTITPATPYIICEPGYYPISAKGFGPPPLQNVSCGTANPNNCANPDSTIVHSPSNAAPVTTSYNSASTPFTGNYATARHQYLLRRSDMTGSGMRAGTLRSLTFFPNGLGAGTAIFSNFKISIRCATVNSLPAGQFVPGAVNVYSAPGIVYVPANSTDPVKFNFTSPYNWDTTQNLIVEICYNNSGTTGTALTRYYETDYNATVLSYASSGNLCNGTAVGSTPMTVNELPEMRFNYCTAADAPFQFTWSPGTFVSDSTAQNPVIYVDRSTKYYVSTKGRAGCSVKDSVSIYVPTHHYDVFPKDTAVCQGEMVPLHAIGDKPSTMFKWYAVDSATGMLTTPGQLSMDNIADPIASTRDAGYNKYAIIYIDSVNCTDTLFDGIIVKANPTVHIVNNDTVINYGGHVNLFVTGASLYSWAPASSLNDPNLIDPVATPVEPTTYIVSAIASNGCVGSDSVKVGIDYRDRLFVPTAFTPNNDGRNDEFKVLNLTFQKVLEFRIFNRWGQEVFSTTDVNGWDGKWKGVDQTMDSYNYFIRIGYPDGYVETYKGTVSLIR